MHMVLYKSDCMLEWREEMRRLVEVSLELTLRFVVRDHVTAVYGCHWQKTCKPSAIKNAVSTCNHAVITNLPL